jgi:hypothetical protein
VKLNDLGIENSLFTFRENIEGNSQGEMMKRPDAIAKVMVAKM